MHSLHPPRFSGRSGWFAAAVMASAAGATRACPSNGGRSGAAAAMVFSSSSSTTKTIAALSAPTTALGSADPPPPLMRASGGKRPALAPLSPPVRSSGYFRGRVLPLRAASGGDVASSGEGIVGEDDGSGPTRGDDAECSSPRHRPLVIVLAGPTAAGKSDVAALLCSPSLATDILRGHLRAWSPPPDDVDDTESHGDGVEIREVRRGHVVSADSVQAYRGVSVGANKPTPAEMEQTPHHLVDAVDPPTSQKASSYNAADWMKDAQYVIKRITSRSDSDFDVNGEDSEATEGEGLDDDDDGREERRLRRASIDVALRQSGITVSCVGEPPSDPSSLSSSLQSSKKIERARLTTQGPMQPALPVVVGGTMMYLQWLVHGRPDAMRPTPEAVIRAENVIMEFRDGVRISSGTRGPDGRMTVAASVEKEEAAAITEASDATAWEAASEYVSSLGPVFANRVLKLCGKDWYRLRRLLEVAYTAVAASRTKIPQQREGDKNRRSGEVGNDNEEAAEAEALRRLTEEKIYTGLRFGSLSDGGYDVRCFFLCPDERMTHFATVDQRCETMLLRGLLRETADLVEGGGLPDESQVARSIGYRQALEYLKRKDPRRNDGIAFAAFLNGFATATRQYAKKQMQWFRRDESFAFVPVRMTPEAKNGAAVGEAAAIIADMCRMSRADFEDELSSKAVPIEETPNNGGGGENNGSSEGMRLSARTKMENERQGKKMKYFISKRERLVEGSNGFATMLAEADECTKRVQDLGGEF